MWSARSEIQPLAFDVTSGPRVLDVGIGSVAHRHAPGRLAERHVEEDREVPGVGEFVTLQEDAVDDQYRGRRGSLHLTCQDGVGGYVVRSGPVATGSVEPEGFQYV